MCFKRIIVYLIKLAAQREFDAVIFILKRMDLIMGDEPLGLRKINLVLT